MFLPSTYALIGSGVASFLFLYASYILYRNTTANGREPNGAMQFLILILFVAGLFHILVVGKAVVDNSAYCDIVPVNDTTMYNETIGEYAKVCFETEYSTNQQSYVTSITFFTISGFLLLLHILLVVLRWYRDKKSSRGRGGN